MPKCDAFFAAMAEQRLALTFDDVRLRTARSDYDFHDADLTTRFSRNITLKTPFVSAAMDTVTESEMAIAIAKLGGIGVIHRNLTPEEQGKVVRRVKKHLNGLISGPICVQGDLTVEAVLQMCETKHFTFRSFPVIDENERLIGVLTGNDIDFCDKPSNLIREVMSTDVIQGSGTTTVEDAYELMRRERIKILPLVDSDHKVAGLYVWSDLKRLRDPNGSYNVDNNGQLRVMAAVGTGPEAVERVQELISKNVDGIVIDASHGDSYLVTGTFECIRSEKPDLDVVVGNISQYDSALRLVEMGVDGIKVGQGGGSICTTRIVTGIGTPQLTAIHNCAKAVRDKGADIPVCGDGGIKEPGDVGIALAAGADSVMLGNMLAGTDESPGEVITRGNRSFKLYRGMGSPSAMEANPGSRERYGERQTSKSRILAEGVEGYVPYTGTLENRILRLSEAVRRSMGLVGVQNISEFHEHSDFDRITNAGVRESHPHDIVQSDS